MLEGYQQLIHPCGDLLVRLREKALLVAADLVGEREVVLLAVFLRKDHLIIWRMNDIIFNDGMFQLRPKRAEPFNEHVVFLLKGFEYVINHF